MMQAFRSFAGKIAAVVFAVLMLVFLWTSVDWRQALGGSRSNVGEINGQKIPLRNYQQMVQGATDQRQRQLGHTLSAEEIEEVRNSVWNDLVQQQSLEQAYEERGIEATPDEILAAIQESPPPELMQQAEFQTDGRFDISKYQRWLHSSGGEQVVPVLFSQYSEQIRQSKLFRVVASDVYLSDAALWQTWRDGNEKTSAEVIAIVPRTAVPDSAVSLTDGEIRAYYDAHREEFKRPATAYLSYVEILRTPDASDTAAAQQRALDLRKEILAGSPFEEVAKRESADSTAAKQGGDLGEFGKGTMDPAFERAAFTLPIGALSEPVLSAFGYHLIKVEKRVGAKVRARHILIPIEITGTHRDALDARADSLESLGADKLDPGALDTAARVLGLRVGAVMPMQKGSRAQIGVQVVPDAGVWAFQAKPGETGRIIETTYAYFLFRLDSLRAEGVPAFEAIKGAVTFAARDKKKWTAARGIATDLEKRLGEGSTLTQAAAALKLPHQEFPPFTRINPPLPEPVVVGAAFGLAPGKPSGVIETSEGLYVIRVIKRDPADSTEFVKQIDDFRAKQIRLARQDRVRNYLEALRTSAKVVDHRAQIYRTDAQVELDQSRQKS